MSYRYSSIDVIVGVGLCAILFGALFVFVATSGTFLVTTHQLNADDSFSGLSTEGGWLQPALGQAIVERALLQRQTDQITAAASSEWTRALQARRSLETDQAAPFGFVIYRANTVPADHAARVEAVMGRSIVNFTRRGVASGMLSADLYLSDYNRDMIGIAESMGERMKSAFASTWQPTLGRWIVDVSREQARRIAGVQEELGTAIVHMTQAKTVLEDAWASNQYQLGSLLAAADRQVSPTEMPVVLARVQGSAGGGSMDFAPTIEWPGIPMGYVILAAIALCSVFFAGITMSAASREARALMEAKRNSARWVYRMAA